MSACTIAAWRIRAVLPWDKLASSQSRSPAVGAQITETRTSEGWDILTRS
jgi:hypothetical protein